MNKLFTLILLSPLSYSEPKTDIEATCYFYWELQSDITQCINSFKSGKGSSLDDMYLPKNAEMKYLGEYKDYKKSSTNNFAITKTKPHGKKNLSCLNTTLIDKKNGLYYVTYRNGTESYSGQLDTSCKRTGNGTYLWSNGDQFDGTWANDNKVYGNYFFANGFMQTSNYLNDKLHGITTSYHPDGSISQQTYKNGQLVQNSFKVIKLSPQRIATAKQNAINAQERRQRINNYTMCLSNPEESLVSCANAWQGYTPKKTYKCDYDFFGNKISSTCREQ